MQARLCSGSVRRTDSNFDPRSWHNLRVRSTNQHQSRTCGGFRSNAFVRQTNPEDLVRRDVYPVALNFDQVGIFTLEPGADDSSLYFSLHAPSSQGGFTADLLLPLRFGVSELRETGRPGGQLAAKRPNSNGRCKQRPTAIYRRYRVDDLISGSVDVNPRFCLRPRVMA